MTIERAIASRQEQIERYQALKKRLKKDETKTREDYTAKIEGLRKQINALEKEEAQNGNR